MSESTGSSLRRLTVDEDGDGMRIDRFLAERLADLSRQRIQSLIRDGLVQLDGRPCKPSSVLRDGQVVSWPEQVELPAIAIGPEPIPIHVIFEDEDLAVLDKPAGLVVHPATGNWTGTLVNALLHRWPDWRPPGGPLRPGIVHRIDKNTSGLLIVARTERAYRALQTQIAAHEMERAYIALVWGLVAIERGTIDRPIGRDPHDRQRMAVVARNGRPAITHFDVLARFDWLTLLRLVLRTGRTHQVRVHLAALGHPVFADDVYGGVRFVSRVAPKDRPRAHAWLRQIGRHALHAYRLAFRHPVGGEWLAFEAPVPADMESVLREVVETGAAE